MDLYPDQTMLATYGDGLANVSISKLLAFHDSTQKLCTVTAVRPAARFGFLEIQNGIVSHFGEKDQADSGWINGGFFVLNSKVLKRIESDETIWEKSPLESLARDGELKAYFHRGFWQPMDTLRDKNVLEELWASGHAPWKIWS
jgi:glucose-1-phosphate cytidylyltransferase